jgi:hypothetical protein
MIKVRTDLLAAVANWAHADPDRPIGAVVFRDGHIVATDGRRLVLVPHELEGEPFGVARFHLRAAIAAQNTLTREPIDPQVGHDVIDTGSDVTLADGQYDNREIALNAKDGRVYLEITEDVAIRVPAHGITSYPTAKALQSVLDQGDSKCTPDGYRLDAGLLEGLAEINTASASFRDGIHVVRWSRLERDGSRSPLVLRNVNGVRFAIMPQRDEVKP